MVVVVVATIDIVGNCPNFPAVEVGAGDPHVGYTPCGTWEEHCLSYYCSGCKHQLFPLLLIGHSNGLCQPLLINGCSRQVIIGKVG
jgi:hypothetical protein